MALFVLVALLAWGSLFVRMPRWCSVLLTLAFLAAGLVMTLFGFAGWYWDSHMQPGASSAAKPMLVCGVLVIASRAWSFFKGATDDA